MSLVKNDATSEAISGLFNTLDKKATSFNNDRSREILKGQCLNIACSAVFHSGDIGFDSNRARAIKFAHKLFAELEDADYYMW
jgi:hypothetical protein